MQCNQMAYFSSAKSNPKSKASDCSVTFLNLPKLKLMPWTKSDYPDSMKNLPVKVRNKAIEIANALHEEKMDEGIAIATGISRAKDWAANRGIDIKSKSSDSRSTDVKKHGEDRYVIPEEDHWAVKEEGSEKVERSFDKKEDAVKYAKEKAKDANASVTIQKRTGKVQTRVSYTPHKKD